MTIIVGFTPRPRGHAAVAKAVEIAKATGDHLFVVNAGVGEAADDKEVASAAEIERLRAQLDGADVSHEVHQFLRGNDAVEEILALEEALPDVSMIVIGVRKRSVVGKLILGSSAQRIIMNAQAPVLSVKGA